MGPSYPEGPRDGGRLFGKRRGGEASATQGPRLPREPGAELWSRAAGQSLSRVGRVGGAQDVGEAAGQGSAVPGIPSPP